MQTKTSDRYLMFVAVSDVPNGYEALLARNGWRGSTAWPNVVVQGCSSLSRRKGEKDATLTWNSRGEPDHDAGWLWYQKFYYREVSIFSYQVNYCPWCGKHIKVPDTA